MGEQSQSDDIAELREALARQAEEIEALRAAVGHLVNGINAAGMLCFDLPQLSQIIAITSSKNALAFAQPEYAKMLQDRKELEEKVRKNSQSLDAALKAAADYVWKEDGALKD